MLIIRILLVLILFIPTFILTIIIYIFGGWTKGFDYMPNPVYALLNFLIVSMFETILGAIFILGLFLFTAYGLPKMGYRIRGREYIVILKPLNT